jgi:hypothetical protein
MFKEQNIHKLYDNHKGYDIYISGVSGEKRKEQTQYLKQH